MFDRRELLLAGAAALAGCATPAPPTPDPDADEEFRTFVVRLADRSRTSRSFLLRQFDATRLTPRGRIVYAALLPGADADSVLAQRAWGDDGLPYAVTHRNGAYRRAGELRESDDPRVAAREVNRDTNRLEGDAARGVIAPDFVIDTALPAVESAAQRAAASGEERHIALAEALSRQVEALRTIRVQAGADAGVWRLPDGEAFYAQTLQFQLGAPVDPREAHERALERCRALQSEADALLRQQGLTRGAVAERLRALGRERRHLYGQDAAGKARAVADMNARLEATRGILASAFDGIAQAPAEVRLLAANLEANGAQGRRQGSVYFVDLGAPRPRWTLPSVVHHELLPGHIFQAPYEARAQAPALQLRYAGGYSEGWSIYAEQLADELGAFSDDPVGRIGYLQWMLFRMGRVVVDTGIHALRWTRQRSIEELRALQGDSIAFVSIEEDVTRFCVQPGAYTAQGLAALHIAELRDTTRRQTRSAFSLPRFHAAMLEHGPRSPPGLDQAARAAFS
jgi:uncharacterized protein (DUF885 family)